ncbi:hypothetical protein B0H11DRAFT_2188493 [Mycena galericulata]|nr:hypothetical protein B0H11DRAFT_2188493 [Mycena galericulata]
MRSSMDEKNKGTAISPLDFPRVKRVPLIRLISRRLDGFRGNELEGGLLVPTDPILMTGTTEPDEEQIVTASRNQKIGDLRALNDVCPTNCDTQETLVADRSADPVSSSVSSPASGNGARPLSTSLPPSVYENSIQPEIPSTRVTPVSSPGCSRGDEYGGAPEDIHASSPPSLADSIHLSSARPRNPSGQEGPPEYRIKSQVIRQSASWSTWAARLGGTIDAIGDAPREDLLHQIQEEEREDSHEY